MVVEVASFVNISIFTSLVLSIVILFTVFTMFMS